MAGEWLFPVPGAASKSQDAELTTHKTREPWPKLPEGTGDMVGICGLWAAQGTRDSGFGSTSVICNAIKCLLLFIWTILVSLEAAAPQSALPVLCFTGCETMMQEPHCSPTCSPSAHYFFFRKTLFPPSSLFSAGEG